MSMLKITNTVSRQINAVVVSAGLMAKTVKVRIGIQKWNNHIRKDFNATKHLLVHDPRSSLRTGDIIHISPGFRRSNHVRHVVSKIIAPFGEGIDARPPVPTEEERIAEKQRKLMAKDVKKGRWKQWGFTEDPRGIKGGEWEVEGFVPRGQKAKKGGEESVEGESVATAA